MGRKAGRGSRRKSGNNRGGDHALPTAPRIKFGARTPSRKREGVDGGREGSQANPFSLHAWAAHSRGWVDGGADADVSGFARADGVRDRCGAGGGGQYDFGQSVAQIVRSLRPGVRRGPRQRAARAVGGRLSARGRGARDGDPA